MAALSDMGGRPEYFGPIVREPNEPVFHSPADGRVFGISGFVLALVGRNLDAFRYAMERLPREVYMSSYYRRMLGGCENLLVQAGYLGPDDARLTTNVPRALIAELLGDRRRVGGRDPIEPAAAAIQQCPEHARAVKALGAVPIDRPIGSEQRGGPQIADDAVLRDREIAQRRPLATVAPRRPPGDGFPAGHGALRSDRRECNDGIGRSLAAANPIVPGSPRRSG